MAIFTKMLRKTQNIMYLTAARLSTFWVLELDAGLKCVKF